MDRNERFHRIDKELRQRRASSKRQLLEALEISNATFKRDLEYLRERLGAPIVWDRELRGYRYEKNGADTFTLPGLWFNADELHALLTTHQLLNRIQPGLLETHIAPLRQRIQALLDKGDHSWEEVSRRVRILPLHQRSTPPDHFSIIATAVLGRKRLVIDYYVRNRDETTRREISPQRLIYYRDNWYLDSWCHLRDALRSFALDAVTRPALLEKPARDIEDPLLDRELGSGYGIFAGSQTQTATLRFTPERARWIAKENWHPEQQGRFDENGYYLLEIPYSDPRELIMEILKFGAEVEVLDPQALRTAVAKRIEEMHEKYGGKAVFS